MRKAIERGLVTLLVLGLPALDFWLVARIVYVASVPDLLSPFWAIVIGCVAAVVVCLVGIVGQGGTAVEVIVPALLLLALLAIVYSVAVQLPEKRRANLQKRALKQQRQPLSVKSVN